MHQNYRYLFIYIIYNFQVQLNVSGVHSCLSGLYLSVLHSSFALQLLVWVRKFYSCIFLYSISYYWVCSYIWLNMFPTICNEILAYIEVMRCFIWAVVYQKQPILSFHEVGIRSFAYTLPSSDPTYGIIRGILLLLIDVISNSLNSFGEFTVSVL